MKRLLVVPLTGALLGAGAAFAAGSAPTNVGISYQRSTTSFGGKVRSPAAACRSRRRITVLRQGGGKLGSVTSDASGKWRLYPSRSFSVGDYYATVSAAKRNGTACAAGRSVTTRAS